MLRSEKDAQKSSIYSSSRNERTTPQRNICAYRVLHKPEPRSITFWSHTAHFVVDGRTPAPALDAADADADFAFFPGIFTL